MNGQGIPSDGGHGQDRIVFYTIMGGGEEEEEDRR